MGGGGMSEARRLVRVEADELALIDRKARGSLAYDEAFCVVKDFVS